MDPPPDLVAALQGIGRGVPGHSHGGNIANAMESSAPIHAYTVPLTSDANAVMAAVRREATALLRSHRGTYATALFGRYAENTAKLAMLAAISRDPAQPVTEARDITWASQLVEHCIGTLLREADLRVSDNDTEAKHKRVLEIIRAAGQISRNALVRKTQFLSKREREEIFDALVEGEQVTRGMKPTGTKPLTLFTARGTPDATADKEASP